MEFPTLVEKETYEKFFQKYFFESQGFYEPSKYVIELTNKIVYGYARVIHVIEKETKSMYAVFPLIITYDPLTVQNPPINGQTRAKLLRDTQIEVTIIDAVLFRIDEISFKKRDARKYNIAGPYHKGETWSIA